MDYMVNSIYLDRKLTGQPNVFNGSTNVDLESSMCDEIRLTRGIPNAARQNVSATFMKKKRVWTLTCSLLEIMT